MRIDQMPIKTKHSVIGTVFWSSIILAIHPLYQLESPWDQVWKWSTMSCDFVYTYLTYWNHFNQLLSFLPPHATYILYQALSGHLPFLNDGYSLCQIEAKTHLGKSIISRIKKEINVEKENSKGGCPSKLSYHDNSPLFTKSPLEGLIILSRLPISSTTPP